MIHIVVALDENYWHKSRILFDSLHHNTAMNGDISVKVLTIGFSVDKRSKENKDFNHHRWEFASCELENLKSYRTDFPKNRPFYVCAEGGEFLDYFDFNSDDIIVHIDSDMILQREFYEHEIELLSNLRYGEIGGSYHCTPAIPMSEEFVRLKSPVPLNEIRSFYPNHWLESVFCAGLIVCTAQTYKDVIYDHYLSGIDTMVKCFDHHAAGQWVMNYIVYEHGNFLNLGHTFHNAKWFIGTEQKFHDNKLWYNSLAVLFNHTKFLALQDADPEKNIEEIQWNYE